MTPDLTIKNLTFGLYQKMPGAPAAVIKDGIPTWDGIEGNEHWHFCEAIVRIGIHVAQAYSR